MKIMPRVERCVVVLVVAGDPGAAGVGPSLELFTLGSRDPAGLGSRIRREEWGGGL